MKDYITGTWWLVKDNNGRRFLVKANNVWKTSGDGFMHSGDKMKGWIGLDNDSHGVLDADEENIVISRKDFEGVNFPEVTYESSPMEIEIGKSGRVYTYES